MIPREETVTYPPPRIIVDGHSVNSALPCVSSSFLGDLEQKFELEISPLCNQQKDSIPSIQIGKLNSVFI